MVVHHSIEFSEESGFGPRLSKAGARSARYLDSPGFSEPFELVFAAVVSLIF